LVLEFCIILILAELGFLGSSYFLVTCCRSFGSFPISVHIFAVRISARLFSAAASWGELEVLLDFFALLRFGRF